MTYPHRQPEFKTCQYGVLGILCGQPATTKRRTTRGPLWDVCERHADFLDRLAENVRRHKPLLDRLAGGTDA